MFSHPVERELASAFQGSSLLRCSSQRHKLIACVSSRVCAGRLSTDVAVLAVDCAGVKLLSAAIFEVLLDLGR